jgi:purine-nucleoside phosphorylase
MNFYGGKMKVSEAVKYISKNLDTKNIDIAVVLGSGLSFLEDNMENLKQINTSGIPGYPVSTVMGHKGMISTGVYAGKKLMIMAGRVHYYEGYSYDEVVFPIDMLHALGVKKLLLTNAAGGINLSYGSDTIVVLEKYIAPFSQRYKMPLKEPFSKKLNTLLEKAGKNKNIPVQKGCYAYMTGPSFETKAEIDYLRISGGDVVGMSTVPETVRAADYGMYTACISRVSNPAAGITGKPLSHIEVLETAKKSQESFRELLKEFIRLI